MSESIKKSSGAIKTITTAAIINRVVLGARPSSNTLHAWPPQNHCPVTQMQLASHCTDEEIKAQNV